MGVYLFAEIQTKVNGKWEPTYNEIGPIKASEVNHLLGHTQSAYLVKDTEPVFDQHRGSPDELFSTNWNWDYEFGRNWITGEEFMAAINSDRKIMHQGYISKRQYEKWDKVSPPSVYSSRSAVDWITFENPREGSERQDVLVTWEESVRGTLGSFANEIIEEMKSNKEIRIVYGFDQ